MPIKSQFKDRLYELFIENAREYGIFFSDPDGKIVDWSPGAERLFGYSTAEALGQPAAIVFTPEDRAAHIPEREMQKSVQQGQSEDERWHMRNDGSRLFVIGYMFALKDESGQLVGFAKIVRDRTKERRMEADLRRNEERLRMALATARIGIWENDFIAGQLFWSHEAKMILGLSTEAKESVDLFISCVHPEDRELVRTSIEKALERPGDYDGKFRVVHSEGSVHFLAVKAKVSFTREGDQPFCDRAYGTAIDITEREYWTRQLQEAVDEATEQLKDKVFQLETFCYAMAHNFRGPIRAVQGFSGVLKSDYGERMDDPARDYLFRISRAAEQMDRLVADLLAYGGGTIRELAETPVDMNRIAAEVQNSFRDVIKETNAHIQIEPLEKVIADDNAVRTVLHGLFSNALRFTKINIPPQVRLRSERRGPNVRTWVEDKGIGIAPQYRDKVFELFHLLDQHNVRATGVGLALAKTMVERMHGAIGFESEVGQGTRFWFELPATPSAETPATSSAE